MIILETSQGIPPYNIRYMWNGGLYIFDGRIKDSKNFRRLVSLSKTKKIVQEYTIYWKMSIISKSIVSIDICKRGIIKVGYTSFFFLKVMESHVSSLAMTSVNRGTSLLLGKEFYRFVL